jgi:signal transduction histidine kinase
VTSLLPPTAEDCSDTSLADRVRALEAECAALRAEQATLALGLSHDLRSPLRAIDSFAHLVEQRGGDALDTTARDHLRRVREAGARIGRLASRLQAYLNAGSAPLQRAPVDLTLLADWCIAELRDAAPREANIDIASNLHARGDERLLKAALQELLHNAWTYSRPDAPLALRIEGERTPDGVHLRVQDNGIGFDAQHAGKLGEPFQRLHVADHPNGSGLGLSIARRIVARHGGTLRIEGEPMRGAIVHVWLPDADGDGA